MTRTVPRTHARWRTGVAIGAASALAVGGALIASPGIAQNLQVDDALFDWQVNAESGGAAPLPGTCHFLAAGEVGDTGGTSGFDESYYAAESGNTTIVKPDSAGVDHVATWDDKCLDPNGNPTRTAADSTSGNRVQITGGTGTVDPDTDTGYIQWDGSWSFVYYSGMTYWTVNDPRLEVEDGHGRIVGTFTGYGASMEDLGKWESLPAVEGTVADFADATVDLTEDGFTVTPDYLGVETETGGSGFDQNRTVADWGSFPQDWVDYNIRTGQSAYWFSSGGMFDPKKPTKPIDVTYTAHEIELAAPTGLASSDVTQTTASLAWDAVDSAESYEVEHRAGAGEWVASTTEETSAVLTDLIADTEYQIRVRAVAGEATSPWATGTVATEAELRPTVAHTVTAASAEDGLQVLLEGSDFTVDRLPPNSAGVAPNQMSSIGYGIVPSSTPDQAVTNSTAMGYGASLLRFLTGGALDATVSVPAAGLVPDDYDIVVWNATQGGSAANGALLHRETLALTDEQREDLFDGAGQGGPEEIAGLTTSDVGDTFATLMWDRLDTTATREFTWREVGGEFDPARKRTISGWGTSMTAHRALARYRVRGRGPAEPRRGGHVDPAAAADVPHRRHPAQCRGPCTGRRVGHGRLGDAQLGGRRTCGERLPDPVRRDRRQQRADPQPVRRRHADAHRPDTGDRVLRRGLRHLRPRHRGRARPRRVHDSGGPRRARAHRGPDRGAHRGPDGGADRGADRAADRGTDRGTDGGTDGRADRGTDGRADRRTDGGTDRAAHRAADGGPDRRALGRSLRGPE